MVHFAKGVLMEMRVQFKFRNLPPQMKSYSVMRRPMKPHPVPQTPFPVCAGLFRHALARPVPGCGNDLQAFEAEFPHTKAGNQTGGCGRNSPPCPARTDPIAKV